MYINTFMCIYIYEMCVWTRKYVYVNCVSIYIHICMYLYIYIYMTHVCTYVCMYILVYIYICAKAGMLSGDAEEWKTLESWHAWVIPGSGVSAARSGGARSISKPQAGEASNGDKAPQHSLLMILKVCKNTTSVREKQVYSSEYPPAPVRQTRTCKPCSLQRNLITLFGNSSVSVSCNKSKHKGLFDSSQSHCLNYIQVP